MTKLAIGVNIDETSLRPETARFIYVADPEEPSPPWLKNPDGDVALPAGKQPVTIQFRLLQQQVTLANNQTYALSLPSASLQIDGPVPGKWPLQFNAPAQSGKPGQPHTVVVVTDKNSDTTTYKYSLAVLFTPQVGAAVERVDDPKIRNGGDTRFIERWMWPVLVVVLALIALIAWRLATAGTEQPATDPSAAPPPPRPRSELTIMVQLTPKGRKPEDGLFFSFLPKDFTETTASYLDDAAGNITIPPNDSTELAITYRLTASRIKIGNRWYGVGFKLAGAGGGPVPHPFTVVASSGPVPPHLFDKIPVVSGHGGTYRDAAVIVTCRDREEHEYRLTVGIEVAGLIHDVEHDPKIRNGGNKLNPGGAGGSSTPSPGSSLPSDC